MTRVLSVEDDADLQRLLAITLVAEGFDVHYAFTGPEGFEKAVALKPDVLLCDMMLPGYGGPELIKRLKANPATREVPIVVVTAFYDTASLVESEIRKLGVIEYLRKPVRLSELVRILRRLEPSRGEPVAPLPPARVAKGRVRLDPASRGVWVDDRLVATLPPVRFEALRALAQSAGPVARTRLMRAVWNRDDCDSNLEKTIQRLREDLGAAGRLLRTTDDGYELAG